ncbi:unnamed protein product [Microthlaspi erraticum]|uniref:Late embryogenesis abundant protein LEA-2 subgroup domain-containing protein n=1 Tax=Microthlaspi erraticum TaxID=1685480 RepID=A0A6D2JNH6_9BRAS|nr:unnamed protein product [Microthlaspi erraticum]CAA7058707.1 unnamed protein product [Microthlaspi erraticum]
MAMSLCSSCGLRSRHCQCREPLSTAGNGNPDVGERAFKLTPASFCICYLAYTLASGCISILVFIPMFFMPLDICRLEVFVDSFSVSNANATVDWNVGFAARNRGKGCEPSLHTIKSRLLRGENLISESSTPDYFGKLVTGKIYEPLSYAVFKTSATPEGLSGVVWDFRVEVASSVLGVTVDGRSDRRDGFLFMTCGDIPVNFTADPAGNVKGSLLGNVRPCEYSFRQEYWDTSF